MSRNMERELRLHQALTPWVAAHSERYPGIISDTGYDPDRYPEQRIDESYTPPNMIRFAVKRQRQEDVERDRIVRSLDYDEVLARASGSYAQSRVLMGVFNQSPAFEGEEISISKFTEDMVEDGKQVALLMDHAENHLDIIKGAGALGFSVVQRRGIDFIQKTNFWTNKLMTREMTTVEIKTDDGAKHSELSCILGAMGGSRWVIPDTETSDLYVPDEDLRQAVNGPAIRQFYDLAESTEGSLEALVPGGKEMKKKKVNGDVRYLEKTPVTKAAAKLLSKMDFLILGSIWSSRLLLANVVQVEKLNTFPRAERQARIEKLAGHITETLGKLTEEVSGLEVISA